MLIGLMKGIALFYYWTWFIWPFVFMFSFVNGLASKIKDEDASTISIIVASISLLIILAGIVSPALS